MKIILGVLILWTSSTLSVDQIIHVGNNAEPRDLDPQVVNGVQEYEIVQNLFEPLVDLDPFTLKPIPGVAESWSSSANAMVWTFKLRKYAKWSNGEPVTAEDFVYSWTRLLDPDTASEYAYFGYFIKNGEAFNGKKITDPKALGLKAKDATTFELTLEKPTPYLMKLLYFMSLCPSPRKTVEKFGRRWTRPENIVTNGPYVPVKWEVNRVIVMKPNPHYWDKDRVTIKEAHFYPTENLSSEERMFRTKKLHVTWTIPAERLPTWQKSTSGDFQSDPQLSTRYLGFSVTKKPLTDKRVRKALALAIDRTQLVKFVTRGNEEPAYSLTPPGTGGFSPRKNFPVDGSRVAEAKKLLEEAGFKDGKGFPEVELLYNTNENMKKISEAVQAMWKKNLGIRVALINQEWKVFLSTTRTHDFQISLSRWSADYDDPLTFLNLFVTGSGNNDVNYSNKTYDALIKSAETDLNAAKRYDTFHKLEEILADDAFVSPLFVEKRNYLLSPSVVGWPHNHLLFYPLKIVKIK